MNMMKTGIIFAFMTCACGLRIASLAPVAGSTGSNAGLVPKEIIAKYQSQMDAHEEFLQRASDPKYTPPDMGMFTAVSKHNIGGKVEAPNNRFEAIKIELPLTPPLILYPTSDKPISVDGANKNLVGLTEMKANGCLVYAFGISGDSRFEEKMATTHGCEVHAFDCTIDTSYKSVQNKHFKFHDWCVGEADAELANADGLAGTTNNNMRKEGGNVAKKLVFKSLVDSMKELGHHGKTIDVLKFDVEGFEWQLFEKELLSGQVLPKQMSFEMHTEGAKPWAVPVANTDGKTNHEVNNVFLRLHKLGYRVVSKEINFKDHACAEFVVVRV